MHAFSKTTPHGHQCRDSSSHTRHRNPSCFINLLVIVETMSKSARTTWIVIGVVVVVVVVAAGITLAFTLPSSITAASQSPSVSQSSSQVPASLSASATAHASAPSSPASVPASSATPAKGPQDSPAPTPTAQAPDGRVSVNVALTTSGTDATGLFAGALIQGVVETTGTCTLTATKGGTTKTATAAAEANASSTSCGLSIPSAELSSGVWTVTIQYSSAKYVGTSGSGTVTVR